MLLLTGGRQARPSERCLVTAGAKNYVGKMCSILKRARSDGVDRAQDVEDHIEGRHNKEDDTQSHIIVDHLLNCRCEVGGLWRAKVEGAGKAWQSEAAAGAARTACSFLHFLLCLPLRLALSLPCGTSSAELLEALLDRAYFCWCRLSGLWCGKVEQIWQEAALLRLSSIDRRCQEAECKTDGSSHGHQASRSEGGTLLWCCSLTWEGPVGGNVTLAPGQGLPLTRCGDEALSTTEVVHCHCEGGRRRNNSEDADLGC
mmetsp:Transcript_49239/g.117166  ORF Transcript_49239/g.117166 Transcript_49239/m.117166 type:complete len:258 (-) Transcript_49239:84-857(-)